MKYKVIVSDLDGTLLNPQGKISPLTQVTLDTLSRKGVILVFATGRHPKDALQISQILNHPVCIIGLNGALTQCHHSGEILYEHWLEPTCITEISMLIQDQDVHINAFDNQGWKLCEVNEMAESYARFSAFPYTVIPPSAMFNLKINKLLLWKEEGIIGIEQTIRQHLGERLEYYRTSPQQLEISPPRVSKASAVTELLAAMGISFRHEAIAFGDGMNDSAMLQQAALGVVMGNAMPELRQMLSKLPVASCNENDGVAHYLQKIFDI